MTEKMWGSEPFWGLGYDWDPDWVLTDRQKELRETLIGLCEKEMRANAKRSDDELLNKTTSQATPEARTWPPPPSPPQKKKKKQSSIVLDVHRRYVATGCDVHLDEHLGAASRARGRRAAAVGRRGRARALDGHRAARPAARAPPRSGEAAPDGGRRSRSRSTPTSTRPTAARRSACSRALFADEPARPTSCSSRRCRVVRPSLFETVEELLGDRPAGVAVVPPLPPRRVRRLRRALGRAGGRRVRPRRAALRADGRRRAARQLHPARPRRRGWSPTCATSPTCRSASIRTSATSPTRAGASTPASAATEYARMALALARGGRADRRRLLRHAARPHRRGARAPRGHAARPPPPRRPRRPRAGGNGRRAAAPPTPWADGRERRLYPLPFPDLAVDPGVHRARRGELHGLALPLPRGRRRPPALPRRRLRHRASSASSSRSTARRTSAPSTSTSARSPTR